MSITVYREPNFGGAFLALGPGFFAGENDLVGHRYQSSQDEILYRAIGSIRVQPNTIVAIYDSMVPTASGGGARVLQGPIDIPDLASIRMADRVSSILVLPFKAYDSGIPRGGGVIVSDQPALYGRRSTMARGDYDSHRLKGDEVRMPGPSIQSISVMPHSAAILYTSPQFDYTTDAIAVVGPTQYDDLTTVGMNGRIMSIRVLYTDPYDVPGRPISQLGSSRDYLPGGGWGLGSPGSRPPFPARPGSASTPWAYGYGAPGLNIRTPSLDSLPGLSAGARSLLFPETSKYFSPRNWAGDADSPPSTAQGAPHVNHLLAPPQWTPAPASAPAPAPAPQSNSHRTLIIVVLILIVVVAGAAIAARTRKRSGYAMGGANSILRHVVDRPFDSSQLAF